MKNKTLLATFCVILLSVIGCGKKETPVTVGPFAVNGGTGVATGQAFGVAFTVAGATGAEVTSEISASPKSSSRADITLADDLKINLQTIAEGHSVSFDLNGKPFGQLQRGDKVEIDKSRNVRVNGEQRASEAAPPK